MCRLNTLSILIITICLDSCPAQTVTSNQGIKLVTTIQLPDVSGRIDHLSYNAKNQILYVAALGNNTVEVVDLKNKTVIHTIKDLHEPQGIKYITENNIVVVANGENGECDIFNADSYQLVSSIKMPGGDADNVRYDVVTGKVYVGYGEGGITILDAKTFNQNADIKLPGHPESFQLDIDSRRIFVNVPDAQMLAIIDLEKRSISERWKIEIAKSNFPMALDSKNDRLFIGCRNPAKLLVINSRTGDTIAQIVIDSDTDDVFYDSSSKQVYVSCGGGYVDVLKQIDPDKYEVISRIESRFGARTSLFIPELNKLIVAAPARSGSEAQLMIYETK
jgi:YVTN family beta-propeller protein